MSRVIRVHHVKLLPNTKRDDVRAIHTADLVEHYRLIRYFKLTVGQALVDVDEGVRHLAINDDQFLREELLIRGVAAATADRNGPPLRSLTFVEDDPKDPGLCVWSGSFRTSAHLHLLEGLS
jgi:hypothetical protein